MTSACRKCTALRKSDVAPSVYLVYERRSNSLYQGMSDRGMKWTD